MDNFLRLMMLDGIEDTHIPSQAKKGKKCRTLINLHTSHMYTFHVLTMHNSKFNSS